MKCVNPDFDLEEMMRYELAPHPTSMFDKDGLLRPCRQKSKLMTTLKVEVSARLQANDPTAIFIDGCALLWVVSWPARGTVSDYVNNFMQYLSEKLKNANVFLVFDRYIDNSIKGLTRTYRDTGASRIYQLHPETALPSKDIVLKVSHNKDQLIKLIINKIISEAHKYTGRNKLVVTGSDPVPLELYNGNVNPCPDLRTTQEEADTILVHQVSSVTSGKAVVISDDTDVFVFRVHFKCTCNQHHMNLLNK